MNKLALPVLIIMVWVLGCKDPKSTLAQQNKAVVAKAFEVVGAGDYEKMGDYIAENYVRHCQATPDIKVNSLTEFKEFIRQDRLSIPDQRIEVKKLVAEGDFVAFWIRYLGTQTGQMGPFPPSNKSASLDVAGIHRIENGKIAESWITWDNITILSQLEHFPLVQDTVKIAKP